MYRALYRKYRPSVFADVVGQGSITAALKNQIIAGKIGHAFMFTGTRGTGKTTCAKIFSKAVNCLSPQEGDPCGKCDICQGLENGSILDVVEIDAASNNGVDNIRDLRDETAYTPTACTYKVYIIDEVHMLSMAAFNALLKIMEEPPSHIIFILATTEIHKVPATILSRCQRYDFGRISPLDLQARLLHVAAEESITLEEPAAELIARLADGAMRDALSILETCCGTTQVLTEQVVRQIAGVTDKSYLFDLSKNIQEKNIVDIIETIAQLRIKGLDIKRFCEELINHYRNIMLAGVAAKGLLAGVSKQDEQRYESAAKGVTSAEAICAIKAFSTALERMGKGTDARVELEIALFNLCYPEQQVQIVQAVQAPQALSKGFTAAQNGFAPLPDDYGQKPSEPLKPPTKAPEKPRLAEQAAQPSIPLEVFSEWEKVVNELENRDKLLFVNLKSSTAYYDGRRILIDAGDLFLEYIRKNDKSKDIIKQTIADVTGKRCSIGPYEKKKGETKSETPTAEQTLQQLSEQGVTVEITE